MTAFARKHPFLTLITTIIVLVITYKVFMALLPVIIVVGLALLCLAGYRLWKKDQTSGSKSSRGGFTLIELLIVILVIGLVILGLTFAFRYVSRGSGAHAEQLSRVHMEKLNWDVTGVSCAGYDTDSDGYIGCQVSARPKGQAEGTTPQIINLECASGAWFRWTDGCKGQMPNYVRP